MSSQVREWTDVNRCVFKGICAPHDSSMTQTQMYNMNYNSLNILILTKINTNLMLLNVTRVKVLRMITKKHLFTVNTTLFSKQVLLCKNKCVIRTDIFCW